jgi:spermidine synthase
VISSDSKINPHYVGNAPLLSYDYYALCRDRLTEAGVMVQWIPLHLPASELQSIVRSFCDAFPHTALFWHYPFNIIQAGSLAPIVVDMDRARRFAASETLGAEYAFLQLNQPAALASTWIASDEGLRAAVGAGPVNTWMRPRLEFTIIRAHLAKATSLHEDDNLRWLLSARAGSPPVKGAYDAETLRRFVRSSEKLLAGYAAGGGIGYVHTGRSHFAEGLRQNPDDWRLRLILEVLDRGRERAPSTPAD